MSSPSTQFAISRRMDIYEPFQQVSMWEESFKSDGALNSGASPILLVNTGMENKSQYIPRESRELSEDDQEKNKAPNYKVLRRLAQNREAARKSRLRKKAYVQQLETSRRKLMQLELEIEKARKQGLCIGGAPDASYVGSPGTINSGIGAFEIEYGHWVEEQHRQNAELRNALQTNASDVQLHLLVESVLNHYSNLFRIKADAAKIIVPQLGPLTDEQILSVNNLSLSSEQAEDALSQGLDKLQQSLLHNIAADPCSLGVDKFGFQMAASMEKIEALEDFVNQADHLRQQTLQHMSRILTAHQAARGLLVLGEYFHHLRALTSIWAARSFDPALPPKLGPLQFKSPNVAF